MKSWLFRSVTFFAALTIGSAVALIWNQSGPIFGDACGIDEAKVKMLLAEGLANQPEFTNVVFDNSTARPAMEMQLIHDGLASYCTANTNKADKSWLGVFKVGEQYVIEPRTVLYGPIESSDFGSFSAMRFKDQERAMLLVSDEIALKPGTVKTVYRSPDVDMENELYHDGMTVGYRREFTLDDKAYVLRVASATPDNGSPISILILQRGEESQIIWFKSTHPADSDIGELTWAGDLDGDGHLDLQVSSYARNGGQLESFLFLSSFATEGNMVGIAGLYSSRCRNLEVKDSPTE